MRPTLRHFLCLVLCTGLAGSGAARAQVDRRERFEPGLIVETGARMGACDVLTFTPDGRHLLATGDDKVVRVWRWDGNGLVPEPTLRWSIYREQRGNIYALALSPDAQGRSVAVGGYGIRDGAVAVLDRATGEVRQATTGGEQNQATSTWSLAFAPSGNQVAYGSEDGSVWLWDLKRGKGHPPQRLGKHAGRERFNHVRLVAFTGEKQLVSVAKNGQVLQWDLARPGAAPAELFRLRAPSVFRVALSPDRRWLAAAGEDTMGMADRVEVRSLDGRQTKAIALPEGRNYPQSLAFDAKGERLAVGVYHIPADAAFYKITGGEIFLYDLTQPAPRPTAGPKPTFTAEALAFHPDGKHLAVAGGDHHEVTLWDLTRPRAPVDVVLGSGRCLWSVALGPDGSTLGFRTQREPNPARLNRWGKGPWRAFDLKQHKWTSARDFRPVEPVESEAGWTVQPDRGDAYTWYVVGPDKKRSPLPLDRHRDGMPRCYTFLKPQNGHGVRLAVGHYWGLSVFALDKGGPALVRKLIGHQGEVMAVAPSADQKLLVSASRDQTVAAWTLADWPSQAELGAAFVIRQGKLVVDAVDPGSPAWEANLVKGDEVVLFAHAGKQVAGRPEKWLDLLRRPVPGLECYFRVKPAGQGQTVDKSTTVRQRPLWRFFPQNDGEWVLWRWRDYYYDTSAKGDFVIGWQVNGEVEQTPAFYRAEQFRKHFHKPEMVSFAALQKLALYQEQPDRVALPELEPPLVELHTRGTVVTDQDLTVTLTAAPRGNRENQRLDQVVLWLNDYQFQTWPAGAGSFRRQVVIPRDKLRRGPNLLTLQCSNRAGGRGEARPVTVTYDRPPVRPNLYGLFVGVGDYSTAKRLNGKRIWWDLSANNDAKALQEIWTQQQNKTYAHTDIQLLLDREATAPEILRRIQELAQKVKPDDRLIFFLGGHGIDSNEITDKKIPVFEQLRPGRFWFCCPGFDIQRPSAAGLATGEIYQALARLPCRKLILLDACHSGNVATNPVRDLTQDGVGPVILAACNPREAAIGEDTIGLGRASGLFTVAVITALEEGFDQADQDQNGQLEAAELAAYVQVRVPQLLDELKQAQVRGIKPDDTQTPQAFLPDFEKRLTVAQKLK